MHSHRRAPVWVIVLAAMLLATLACNAPGAAGDDATPTLIGLLTLSPPAGGSEQPAATPTAGPSPTPSGPTITPAPQQCTGTATGAVNVRTGPSTYHPILRVLGEDEQAVITGHNGNRTWWQIQGTGWVSASYITTSGNCDNIGTATFPPAPPTFTPTYTPTPTTTPTNTPTITNTPTLTLTPTSGPTANFSATFLPPPWTCTTFGRVSFLVNNTGSLALESMQYRVEGPVGTYVNGAQTDTPFKTTATEDATNCIQAGAQSLAIGASGYVHLNLGGSTPAGGTAGRAIIKLCSQNGLSGSCKEVTVDFTF